jgi:CDP-glucose 4,6-dehydratase
VGPGVSSHGRVVSTGGDFWHERRVFVTGATGIVGSWLVRELLASGAHVAVLVRDADPQSELLRSGDLSRCTVFNGTVEDLWTLERAISLHEAEYVFHLAAQTIVGVAHRNPFTTFETNVRGTYNLLEACRIHASLVRGVIVASSDKAYGEVDALPYVETMPLRGRHPYEVSKSCTDLIASSYCHSYGVPVVIARCGNIYGGGDLNWSRIVPGTIRSLMRGERPTLRSDGTFRRDYIYVKDVARAYMLLGERASDPSVRGEAFNFSDESPLSVLDIVNAIRELMASDLEPDVRNVAQGEIRDQYLSAAKARETLRWHAAYDLETGLRETIAWYRSLLA